MKYYSEKTVKKIMRKVKVEEIQDSPYDNLYTIQRKYPDLNKFDSIEIKEQHGRLIDADELVGNISDTYCEDCPKTKPIMCKACEYEDIMDDIENAPTVLEATNGTNNQG